MSGDASIQTANDHDQDSEKWLEQVLPLIRVRKCRPWTFFPDLHEVFGLYPSEIVVTRKRIGTPIPESAYTTDGAGVLKELGRSTGSVTSIPLDEVSQVVSYPRAMMGECERIKAVAGKKKISFPLLQRETPNIYRTLRLLLGPRYQQENWIPFAGLYRALSFSLFFLYTAFFPQQVSGILSTIGLNLDAELLMFLAGFLFFIASIILLYTIGHTIPVRNKAKLKKKIKPVKDLSGQQPLRLRIAGRTLTIAGSLLVLFALVVGITISPELWFGELWFFPRVSLGESHWYLRLFSVANSVLCVFILTSIYFFFFNIKKLGIGVVYVTVISAILDGAFAFVGMFQAPDAKTFYLSLEKVCPYIGLVMIQFGQRMVSRNALSVLAEDSRAPILYLRSFESDVEDTLTPHTALPRIFGLTLSPDVRHLPFYFMAIFELQPVRLLRSLFGLISPNTELQLANFFREFGPFIAIGRPGEQLATIGADRVYVGNDEWKKVVTDFLEQSRFVVLQAAGTEGFIWELHTVLETVAPEKLLFCLSSFCERQNDYEDFRLNAESTPGWRFPRSVGNLSEAQFLFFDSNRAPIMHAVSYRSPLKWLFSSQIADFRHTLTGFIDRTERTDSPYQTKRYLGHSFLAVILFLTAVPLCLSLVCFAFVEIFIRFIQPLVSST